MIEHYLTIVTFIAGIVLLAMTAGPGSRLPLFPDRLFLFSLALSLMSASLFYVIRYVEPSDQIAKLYSQFLNCIFRTTVAITGSVMLIRWAAKCRKIKARQQLAVKIR